MKLSPKTKNFISTIQLLSLLTALCGIILFDTLEYLLPDMEHFLNRTYFAFPLILFLFSLFIQPPPAPARRNLLLSLVALLWFATVQQKHQQLEMGTDSCSLFAISYLLAFPFATATAEGTRKAGIRWLGRIYIAASLILVLCAALLLSNAVPDILTKRIYWDGTRLNALYYPTVGACLFMIGIGFTLYFFVQTDHTGKRILLALLAAIQFCGISLTNTRTSILLTCILCGGSVFLVIYNGGWKRLAAGVAAALAVSIALFFFSRTLFDFHTNLQNAQQEIRPQEQIIQQVPQETSRQDETEPPENSATPVTVKSSPSAPPADESKTEQRRTGQNTQGTFMEDIWTLNKRTYTWNAAIQAILENPSLRIWGTKYVSTEISYRNKFKITHAHNSWIQTTMELGLPGLLISLVYTGIALLRCAGLLLRRNTEPEKKLIVLLVLCIMMASFLEPFLFVGGLSTTFANFAFLFLTGYLDSWSRKQT